MIFHLNHLLQLSGSRIDFNRHLAKLFGSDASAPPKGMRLKPHFLVLQEL